MPPNSTTFNAITSGFNQKSTQVDDISSPRSSFSSCATLIDAPEPKRATIANASAISRTTTTTTTTTSTTSTTGKSGTPTAKGRRKKLKKFLKRVGNGMLESLAYANGLEYSPTAVTYHDRRRDERSNDEVLGDIYGVQLLIW